MSLSVPVSLLRHHGPNIYGMFSHGLRSALPLPRPATVETPTPPLEREVPAPPAALVRAYAEWTGAPPERYAEGLPPHLFSYWGMALIAELTALAPYNLLSVLNQGCRVQTRKLLPIGEAIQLRGHLADVADDGRRVRIETQLQAGSASVPDAQCMTVMAAVPRKGAAPRKSGDKHDEPTFETVGRWSASRDDGLNFALLTGDFNPIHTFWPLARRTRYRGCILHGFGFLSRSYETVLNAGLTIAEFDLRYVKPLALPATDLAVQISPASNGQRALRLRAPDGSVHLAGHFREQAAS